MARLILVGLPGVGKSTVARELASRWHCESLDTDEVFLAHVGLTPAAFLRAHDEPSYRLREVDALVAALDSSGIVATGGGVVCTSRGRAVLARAATVWLDCPDDVIVTRLGDVERPLLGDDPLASLTRLRAERSRWYEEVSSVRVDATGPLDDVVTRVVEVERTFAS